MAVSPTGVSQVRSDQQGLQCLLYVFTLTEINKNHNILGPFANVLAHISVFPLAPTYKNSDLASSSKNFESLKPHFPCICQSDPSEG